MPTSFELQTPAHRISGIHYSLEKPKGAILVLHGFGEHQGRYVHIAEAMNAIGLDVYSMDLSGHGLSEGKRGDIESMDQYHQEIFMALKLIRASHSEHTFLYGHSMGGLVAASYCLKRKPELKGLILSSPWFKLAIVPPPLKLKLAKILVKLKINFAQNAGINADHLSSNLNVGKAYLEDDLVHGKLTARAFFEIYNTGLYCIANAEKINVPTFCTHGTDDRIIAIEGTKSFAKKAKAKFKAFAGARHEPHNEVNQDLHIKEYADWLADRINS